MWIIDQSEFERVQYYFIQQLEVGEQNNLVESINCYCYVLIYMI